MTTYTGELTPLRDCPVGSVLQTTEVLKNQWGVDIPAGSVFILRQKNREDSKGDVTGGLQVEEAPGFLPTWLFGANYSHANYSGHTVLGRTIFNLLTGRKAGSTLDAQKTKLLTEGILKVSSGLATSGSDPEVFVLRGDGTVFPAWEFLKSQSASKPDGYTINTQVYWDGFQAECAPASGNCCEGLKARIGSGLREILIAARDVDPKAQLTLQSVVAIPAAVMATTSREHSALGCSPSLNVYGAKGLVVDDPTILLKRFAGGHIHLGNQAFREPELAARLVRAFDRTVGIASVGMYEGIDDPFRRRFYGLAGEYRLPSHGIEYRTLSNAWLCHPAVYYWTYDMIRAASAAVLVGLDSSLPRISDEETQEIINSGDVKSARRVCEENSALWKLFCRSWYGNTLTTWKATERLIQEGVAAVVTGYSNIENNWGLESKDSIWSSYPSFRGTAAFWAKPKASKAATAVA